jgi:hypothetical protein
LADRTLRVLLAACFFCAAAHAGQGKWLDKAQADEAAAFIRKHRQVVLYCAEPDCEDHKARVLDVRRIESRKSGAHYQLVLNGAPVDSSEIYFPEFGKWFNLAIRLNLLEAGVPEELPTALGLSTDCIGLGQQAEQRERRIVPIMRLSVIGEGRLHLHRAPHNACRDDKVFVIPGDALVGYAEYEGWTWVMYVNPRTNDEFRGWVPDARIKNTGTMAPR